MDINKKAFMGLTVTALIQLFRLAGVILLVLSISVSFGFSNTAEKQATEESFKRLAGEISTLLNADTIYATSSVSGVGIYEGYAIVPFNKGHNNLVAHSNTKQGRGSSHSSSLEFQKPNQCQGEACICLFNEIDFEKDGVYTESNLALPCVKFDSGDDLKFVELSQLGNGYLMGVPTNTVNNPYPSDFHSPYEKPLRKPRIKNVNVKNGYYELEYHQALLTSKDYLDMAFSNKKIYLEKYGNKDIGFVFLIESNEDYFEYRAKELKIESGNAPLCSKLGFVNKEVQKTCSCGYSLAIKSYVGFPQFCCENSNSPLSDRYFVSSVPCNCHYNQIEYCSDYKLEENCNHNPCAVFAPACAWDSTTNECKVDWTGGS